MLHAHCNMQSGGGRHSLIWPKQVRAAQQGMVFRVLCLKQGIQFYFLASCIGCLFCYPTCGYQQFLKSHSMMSFIKKYTIF